MDATDQRTERHREQVRRWRRRNMGRHVAISRDWEARNKESRRAHHAVETALHNGSLRKHPCEDCGTTVNVMAHHEDYSKPLLVRWLCGVCHKIIHRN